MIVPPISIICGPPGSGKTTHVMQRMRVGDLVIDLDRIWKAISFQPTYEKPEGLLPYVLAVREALYETILTGIDEGHVWIITGGASRIEREHLRQRFNNAEIVIIKTEPQQCACNIAGDECRSDKVEEYRDPIQQWWSEYRRSE